MRAVVQRVSRASVTVAKELVGAIGPGLLVLVGATRGDTAADVEALFAKLITLRIFADEGGQMNRSVTEAGGGVLVVSQFTVYGEVRKGRRPSFAAAASPEIARPMLDLLVERFVAAGIPVATGRFGALMEVDLVNDGPITLVVETVAGRVI